MSVRWISASDLSQPNNPDADSAALAASWVLYKLSGEKYPGIKTSTDWYGVDPERVYISPDPTMVSRPFTIYEVDDARSKILRLRSTPVHSIDQVSTPDGIMDPTEYVIGNKAFILRTDGLVWDLSRGVTVSYTHGVLPPEAGIRAAQRLADELVLSIADPANCALPDRVTSVSRQGIEYTILDPQNFINEGRTGIYEIDMFLHAANPTKARKRPRVFSPDLPSGRRLKN